MEANARGGINTIHLPANTYALTRAGVDEDAAAAGDLDITTAMMFIGKGSGTTVIDAKGLDRVFHVLNGSDVVFQGLTITGGDTISGTNQDGAGIYNYAGSIALVGCVLSQNSAARWGGGVENLGDATLTDCTLLANTAEYGGGVDNYNGTLTLENCTLSGNSALEGGAIYNDGVMTLNSSTLSENSAEYGGGIENWGKATLTDCTVSGNSADADGGGIYNDFYTDETSSITLNSVTITENTADFDHDGNGTGGGIHNATGGAATVTLGNTIVALNTNGSVDSSDDCTLDFVSKGYNLIGVCDAPNCTGFSTAGDLLGTSASPIDPRLGSLQNNGGLTETRALLEGSPAIDAGDGTCPATDQRGLLRPQGAACDIGAFEFGNPKIILSSGWNLFSLPLLPSDTTTENVLSSVSGSYEVVWKYESGVWTLYDPGPPASGALMTLEPGFGY